MSSKTLKSVIIEDEEESLHLLHNLLDENGMATVIGSTSDPDEALNLIVSCDPDIVFLDIKMPGKTGFDILDDLRRLRLVNPYVVFTTAFDEFAVKAFKYAAFDYLLKPVDPDRLSETLIRCADTRNSANKQQADLLLSSYRKLLFRNISGILFIEPSDIVYIAAEGNYSVIYLSNGKTETVTMLLGRIEEQLPVDNFFRISRSYIINTSYLKKINTKQSECILTKNGNEFKCSISRDRVGVLVSKMKLG